MISIYSEVDRKTNNAIHLSNEHLVHVRFLSTFIYIIVHSFQSFIHLIEYNLLINALY